MNYRKHLEALINDSGGEYRGNLTKDITHLIAKVPSGAKFSFAGEWGIKTVSVEWLTHTLERGMILEESLYNLHLPESERGKNAWVRKTVSTVFLGKREREQGTGPNQPRKLRRTASAKLSTQNVGLWSDIVGGGTGLEVTKRDQWDDQQTGTLLQMDMLEAKRPESAQSNPSFVKEGPNSRTQRTLEPNLKTNQGSRWQNAGIFQDRRFHIHGFNEEKVSSNLSVHIKVMEAHKFRHQNSILAKHLISNGAELLPDVVQLFSLAGADANHRILLMPHTMAASMIPSTPPGMSQPTVVTDMWVERCLHRKVFVNPQLNATSTPFQTFPISGTALFHTLRGIAKDCRI